jgi:hypothetical protein
MMVGTPVKKKAGVVKMLLIAIIFVFLLYIIHQLWTKKAAFDNRRPWIMKGTKSGKVEKVVSKPYDKYSLKEVTEIVVSNEESFLNIIQPELGKGKKNIGLIQ